MIRESSAVAARQNLGDLLNQVQYRNDAVLITKDGKPVAALVDVALFERIRRMRDEFIRRSDGLAQADVGAGAALHGGRDRYGWRSRFGAWRPGRRQPS